MNGLSFAIQLFGSVRTGMLSWLFTRLDSYSHVSK